MANRTRSEIASAFLKDVAQSYTPDFNDSLIAVMRDPRSSLSERVLAWAKWRAWGNSSRYAVSDWQPDHAYPLDQIDCALDLGWLEEGRPVEWITGMPRIRRRIARERVKVARTSNFADMPERVIGKSAISKAFRENELRGTIDFDGRRIVPVVSPAGARSAAVIGADPVEALVVRRDCETDAEFLEWWKVSDPRNFQALQEARAALNAARKVARTAYREFRGSRTCAESNLINEEVLKEEIEEREHASPNAPPSPPRTGRPDAGDGLPDGGAADRPLPDPRPVQLPPAGRSEITTAGGSLDLRVPTARGTYCPGKNRDASKPKRPSRPIPRQTAPELSEITNLAVIREDPERKQLWDLLRDIFKGCGKPVSVEMQIVCRAEFFKYPVEDQRRIVEDAMTRVQQDIWSEARYTPYPLNYLRSRDWDVKPVCARSFPPAQNDKEMEKQRQMERMLAWGREDDRKKGKQ